MADRATNVTPDGDNAEAIYTPTNVSLVKSEVWGGGAK